MTNGNIRLAKLHMWRKGENMSKVTYANATVIVIKNPDDTVTIDIQPAPTGPVAGAPISYIAQSTTSPTTSKAPSP